MPSQCPFPGADPFIDADEWYGLGLSMSTYACEALKPSLPADLLARMRAIPPVLPPEGSHDSSEQPARVDIAIRSRGSGDRVCTVIHFLTPGDKTPGDGMEQYRQKQRECRAGGVNLVEIDLLRGGRDVLLAPRNRFRPQHRQHYTACVFRPERWPKLEVYPISLRAPLPAIRIPLRAGRDADVVLDLQALFDKSYTNGAYDDTDYGAPLLPPPLSAEDAAWATERIAEARRG